jgi:hypothetical protein
VVFGLEGIGTWQFLPRNFSFQTTETGTKASFTDFIPKAVVLRRELLARSVPSGKIAIPTIN